MKKTGIKVIALMMIALLMNGLKLNQVEAASTKTLKNGDILYVEKGEKDVLFKFSLKSDSIITLCVDIFGEEEEGGYQEVIRPDVYILNSKKKAVLTAIKKEYTVEESYSYFLKKGTYYVKVVGPAGHINLKYGVEGLKNIATLATSKSKAKLVKRNNDSVFVATNNNKKDTFWFKIKTSESEAHFSYEFLTKNNSKLRFTLYNSKGKKIADDDIRPLEPGDIRYEYAPISDKYDREADFGAYFQSNVYKGPNYPYGTYYIKVEELNKECNWAFSQ